MNDLNHNGVQDAGEPGLASVTVNLRDAVTNSVLGTTTTNAAGAYAFTGLCAASCKIEVVPPVGAAPTTVGSGGNPALDSNPNPATVTLPTSGTIDTSIDYGFNFCSGKIGDFVWNDLNRNGIQDPGEPGIAGVTVRLVNPSTGAIIASTLTNATGAYTFSNVCFGNYRIVVLTPSGFVASLSNQGSDDTKDSDGSGITVNLPADTSINTTLDFGFSRPCTGVISDFVWNDLNRNGIQDVGEPGLGSVAVRLTNTVTGAIRNTTTNASGAYGFTGLCVGSYRVEVTTPAGFVVSPSNLGGDDSKDSDGSGILVNLPNDNTPNTITDFGFTRPCSGAISDFVWNDADRDGIQDAGEAGISGVTVRLVNPVNGAVLATTTTDLAGKYAFAGLCASSYRVDVVPPTGRVPSPSNQGGVDSLDSDGSGVIVNLATDFVIITTVDFGFNPPCAGAISDFVWNDLNRNGVQDAGEPGLPGVAVKLTNTATNAVVNATTNASGAYSFGGLCVGNYRVDVATPVGFVASPSNQGANDAIDSDGTGVVVSLPNDITVNVITDFGFNRPCSSVIGDFVWNDLNRNGIQDAGEPGLANTAVKLTNTGSGTVTNGATNGSGFYSFTGLCSGTYRIELTIPSGFVASPSGQGGDVTRDSNATPTTVVLSTDFVQDVSIDFGLYAKKTYFIVLDEDAIDNNGQPNFFSAFDVNDDIPTIGQRKPLRYFANPTNFGKTIVLHSGQVGDEGWFAVPTIPSSWANAGPTGDGFRNFFGSPNLAFPYNVGPGLGTADSNGDREALLDKIANVTPLRAKGLKMLADEQACLCAVVWDSDISMNYGPLNGSLKGENLGIVAFQVLKAEQLFGFSSSSLPKMTIKIVDPIETCRNAVNLFVAPKPPTSSIPMDINPNSTADDGGYQ